MWRRYYESNDDSGGGAAPPDPGDYLGLITNNGEDGADLIVQAVNAANAPEPTDADGGAPDDSDAASDDSGGESSEQQATPEDLILGRFKTKDDVIQAYQNLEPEFTQTRQQMREYERQLQELTQRLEAQQQPSTTFEFESPYSNNPTNIEELEQLAERDPARAAMWAMENSGNLPGELVQETVNYWYTRNPAQANAFMLQQMIQQYMPQIDQRLAPVENDRTEARIQSAVNMAEATIGPNYGQYHDRIVEQLESNPNLLPDDATNPQAMHDTIVRVYAMLLGQDMLAKGTQAAQGAAPPPATQAPHPAATATRPTASAPAGTTGDADEDAIAKQLQDMILNARG